MVIALDSAILDLTERFCRWFQRLTGRTNVWLAAQLTNLSIIVYFVWVATYFRRFPVAARVGVAVFCSGMLYVLFQTVFKVSIEASEGQAYHRVAKGFRNPRRLRDAPLRIAFLTLSVVLFYPFVIVYINLRMPITLPSLGYPLVVLTTVVLYLLACDPLPPCAGRLRERFRGLALLRVPIGNRQVVPHPDRSREIALSTVRIPRQQITQSMTR